MTESEIAKPGAESVDKSAVKMANGKEAGDAQQSQKDSVAVDVKENAEAKPETKDEQGQKPYHDYKRRNGRYFGGFRVGLFSVTLQAHF